MIEAGLALMAFGAALVWYSHVKEGQSGGCV